MINTRHIFVRFVLFSLCAAIFISRSEGQDISRITKEKPFDFSGSLGINQSLVLRNSSYSTYDPYSLFINGNASLSLYGFAFPFAFSYSNQQVNFSQPFNFNRFGIQPTYKWIKTMLGYNTMSVSPYSLNGYQFLGAGIELTPEKPGIKIAMMYGRLVKPVEWNPLQPENTPYYRRNGFALKLGYNFSSGSIEASVFNTKDVTGSILPLPDSVMSSPKDNIVYTLSFRKTFFKRIRLSGEYGSSGITNDTRQFSNESQFKERSFFFIKQNATTIFSNALRGNVDFTGNGYSVGVAYERIDPDYMTLGAYYINNDFENMSLTFSRQFFKGKFNLSGSGGTQRNDLDNKKLSSSRKFLGNLNVSYSPSQKLSISSTYSSFSYFTYMKTPFDRLNTTDPYINLDTLNFTQVSSSANLNCIYYLGVPDDKSTKRLIMVSLSFQESDNRQKGTIAPDNSYFYQGNLAYSHNILPSNLSFTTSFLGSYTGIPGVNKQVIAGPVLGINKLLFNRKLSTNASLAYNMTIKDKALAGKVMSLRTGGSYTIQKSHRMNLNMAIVSNNKKEQDSFKNTFELTASLGYIYIFNDAR